MKKSGLQKVPEVSNKTALTAEGIRIEQYELNDVYVPKNNTNVRLYSRLPTYIRAFVCESPPSLPLRAG